MLRRLGTRDSEASLQYGQGGATLNHHAFVAAQPPRGTSRRLAERKGRLRFLRAYFRHRRHRLLSCLIESLPRPVRVLDVGGSPFFWETVQAAGRCEVTILNKEDYAEAEERLTGEFTSHRVLVGDACRMDDVDDQSFDLVVCNSVLEHLGAWPEMTAAAQELARIGRHGWVQIPAIEFPIEPHLMLPVAHWFNRPLQRRLVETFQRMQPHNARELVDRINLVSRKEMRLLFPQATVRSERFLLLPKSHLAIW